MEYTGDIGRAEFDEESGFFHGEVTNTHDVITFQGDSESELHRAFIDSIEEYLEFCETRGEKPEKPHPSRSGNATALDQR
jgi:predicted HicB family RNase H-like nuclease